jgi:hypothetical protein
MAPWAAAKWKEARPPFGAKQTFERINDPVQRYCDPPGITRIYMYPWEFTMIQTPKMVYILYEFTRVWRSIAMVPEHRKDPDPTWMGDSIGRYEGDTFVIFSGKKDFIATTSPMEESICAYSEYDAFQKTVIDPTTKSPGK